MFGSLRLSNTIKDDMGHAPNKFNKIGLDHMQIELKTVRLSLAIDRNLKEIQDFVPVFYHPVGCEVSHSPVLGYLSHEQ